MKIRGFIFYTFLFMLGFTIIGFTGKGSKDNLKLFAGGSTQGDAKGLFLYDFSLIDGSLKLVSDADAGPRPSFFCFSRKYKIIYVLNEVSKFKGNRGGGVTTLKYDTGSGGFEKINEILVPYGGPCHISISPENDFLLLASYGSGSVAAVKLGKKGIPESVTDTILYETKAPNVSHPHMISYDPAGKHIYHTDLGLDRVMVYDLDHKTGKLTLLKNGVTDLPKGSGPRHFIFNADGSKMYLINELGSTLMVFDVNNDGSLKLLQTLPTLRQGFQGKNACADVHIGKDGKYLYGSNRGENTIVIYNIAENGSLSLTGHVSCGGDGPRNFTIDPSGNFLLVGNQRTNNISVLRINGETGLPSDPVTDIKVEGPACLKFLKMN
jgi:6-phosphogluconolactonase